jgi:hypothetical protein
MDTQDVIDELMACRLASTARGLVAALVALEPAERRHVRTLDRWYGRWAADVREHQELVQVYVLPRLAADGSLDERLLDELAAHHVWIDELVGELGDAIGILAFNLGDADRWRGRAISLAECLADQLRIDAERLGGLVPGVDAGLRRALAPRPARLSGWMNRLRPVPVAALAR